MICLKQLEDRSHSTLVGGEAYRDGQNSAGSSDLSSDSAPEAQQWAVEAATRAQSKKRKEEDGQGLVPAVVIWLPLDSGRLQPGSNS